MSNITVSRGQRPPKAEKSWLRHTMVTAGITAMVTIVAGICGALFSDWLGARSKTHDLDLAATRRAIESVESMTNLIFERDTRAGLVASSIKRHTDINELKERKKQYDEIFVRYNSYLQSNLFNIRDIFHTVEYTTFENLLEGPVRDLFIAEDQCITSAYDVSLQQFVGATLSASSEATSTTVDFLQRCTKDPKIGDLSFEAIHKAILHCEYAFSDNLFRVVASPEGIQESISPRENDIRQACMLQSSSNQSSQTATNKPLN